MKKHDRSYLFFLEDIVISMTKIQEYIADFNFEKFRNSTITVDAVIRNFEIIGEAVKHIPIELKLSHPEIPWDQMYRLRNRVSHEYFGISYEIIWEIAAQELPKNKIDIQEIIKSEIGKNTP